MNQRPQLLETKSQGTNVPYYSPLLPTLLWAQRPLLWAQYSILAKNESERIALLEKLKAAAIPTAIYYLTPLHLQTAFESLGYKKGDFPISEDCSNRIFSLPMYPYLPKEDQEKIAKNLD